MKDMRFNLPSFQCYLISHDRILWKCMPCRNTELRILHRRIPPSEALCILHMSLSCPQTFASRNQTRYNLHTQSMNSSYELEYSIYMDYTLSVVAGIASRATTFRAITFEGMSVHKYTNIAGYTYYFNIMRDYTHNTGNTHNMFPKYMSIQPSVY